MMLNKCKCLNCGFEFEFESASEDELGWHTTCPECTGSFDIDINDYLPIISIHTETKTVAFKDFELAELNIILDREEKRLTAMRLENLRNDSLYRYASKELEKIERIQRILNE